MGDLLSDVYNPDVLLCLANLSSDEVFTSPEIVNQMLDMLPQELFENSNTTFLDPACKSGVFLREIAKRLMMGLEKEIPNIQERVDHIMHRQLYGIAITELTSLLSRRSLYCSKYPNGPYSISKFDDIEGNIRYKNYWHTWENGMCRYCGAPKKKMGEQVRNDLETHAYEFIHNLEIGEIYKMKFDVIIGNPPYQLEDEGNGKSAKPIYQNFVNQAKKLAPRYMSMIIPSRWFTGGKGLEEFRTEMLNDEHIRKLVDYENYKDVFPGLGGLAGGACYFLWDRDHAGKCEIVNKTKTTSVSDIRKLNEFDVFIRSNKAMSIVRKVQKLHTGKYMDEVVSSRKPFNLPTNYQPKEEGIPCQFIQRIGLKYADEKDVKDNYDILDKWKFIAPKAPIAGQTDFSKPVSIYYESNTKILPPGTCCTESYIVLFSCDTKEEIMSFKSYLFTKTVRFLLLLCVVSQDITKDKFRFVPALDNYSGKYNDEDLCEIWNITEDEWKVIDSKINSVGDDE